MRRDETKLNVHIVCHTHDDAGWLKTVDQYFYGANNSIQVAGVQYILDTVVQSLEANPDRKFVYADMAFFMRWWAEQDEDTRGLVSRLVENGQLDFVNGGYVQHDEAGSHYVAMIDQTTRGHMFLRKAFGKVPRVGWQIDPFGHSSTQAGLLGAHVGFDALFFGRADYQDMDYRKGLKALEMVWRGSGTLEDAEIFTGNFASGNYGPPPGFWWDWWGGDAPVMDDARLAEYNVQERVDSFVARCKEIANVTRGNDIIVTMGSDFWYSNAHVVYKNLDKLIHYLNEDGRINTFYSTPAKYVEAKHGYNESWPLKTDDFFPYADSPHAYWTGYFSSRPTSKRFIRLATSYLQAARQLEAFVGVNKTGWTTDALEEAISLTQHHDAITGTEKQHVANDYHRRLHKGLKEAQQVALAALSRILRGENHPPLLGDAASGDGQGAGSRFDEDRRRQEGEGAVVLERGLDGAGEQGRDEGGGGEGIAWSTARRRLQAGGPHPNPIDVHIDLHACDWLNISACPATVHLSNATGGGGPGVMVVAYNPLAWGRVAALRVPLANQHHSWTVVGPEGEAIASQLVPVAPSTWCLQRLMARVNATCPAGLGQAELVFLAELPPTGYNAYYLRPDVVSGGTAVAAGSSGGSSAGGDAAAGRVRGSGGGGPVRRSERQESWDSAEPGPAQQITQPVAASAGGWPASLHGEAVPASAGPGAAAGRDECDEKGRTTLDNGIITLEFECERGILVSMKTGDAEMELVTRFAWYNSSDGLDVSENRGQASGAYIFRPNGVYDIHPGKGKPLALEIVRGDVVSEARQAFNSWATLITSVRKEGGRGVQVPGYAVGQHIDSDCLTGEARVAGPMNNSSMCGGGKDASGLYAGQPYVEFEWTVGPIPYEDHLGREVVVQYVTDLDSGDAFWTDANGREMIKRVRDQRPAWELNVTEPAAGNYYPLTAAMYIQDNKRQVALLTERAQGGASLRSGELEVMVHRRTAVDDWRGVAEPLNETVCGCTGPDCNCTGTAGRLAAGWLVARGVHWLVLSPLDTAARERRYLQQLLNDPPLLGFAPIPIKPEGLGPAAAAASSRGAPLGADIGIRRSFTMNERGLPKNVHLLTFRDTGDKSFLVRLAHLFEDDEDPDYGLSKPIHVDLNLVMQLFQYQEVSEMSLTANQLKADADKRLRFRAGEELRPGLNTTSSSRGQPRPLKKHHPLEVVDCRGPEQR
ncbi:hypothetical protein N2152v2_008298 [Parachlorella kessleri]